MDKKKIIIIILVLLILFGIYMLYNTFAVSTIASNNESNNTYDILVGEGTTITVPKGSSKTIYFHLKNTNNGSVKYALGYNTTANIEVKVYEDSKDKVSDIIGYTENKYIKLYLKNPTNNSNTVTITSVLGYENGGDLIVPDGITLITEVYTPPKATTLADYITNLYTNASKTKAQNNGIDYNYASSVSLMNDKLGGTTTDLDGGNIRYYGASPNNYIYFNCSDYNNQTSDTCELWRIIGVFNNQVKIMRNEYIILTTWDIDKYENEWSKSVLMKLLNPGYETSEQANGSLYYNSKSGSCYRADGGRVLSFGCDFTSTGIKNEATKSKIAIVNWNTGGSTGYKTYANVLYNAERGNDAVSSSRTTSWTGKIALPYPSDYGYAIDFTSCNYNLGDYSNCTRYNWMYKTFYTKSSIVSNWLLTPNSEKTDRVYAVRDIGDISDLQNVNDYEGVVPALFLNQEETIVDGNTGSSIDPYKLKP